MYKYLSGDNEPFVVDYAELHPEHSQGSEVKHSSIDAMLSAWPPGFWFALDHFFQSNTDKTKDISHNPLSEWTTGAALTVIHQGLLDTSLWWGMALKVSFTCPLCSLLNITSKNMALELFCMLWTGTVGIHFHGISPSRTDVTGNFLFSASSCYSAFGSVSS